MVARASVCTKPATIAALGFILLAAGCQSGNPLGALNMGGGQQEPAEERITVEELLAYCPTLTIRQSDAVYDSYQRGGEGDASRLVYRASIADATRACSYGDGVLSMTVAIAGRIVPGPAGSTGALDVPIRVTVYRDTEAIYDQLHNHQVAVADTAGATQFVFTDTGVVMPNPTARNIRIIAGFDNPRQAATQ